ncbi:MAG TPA: lactate utilization protein [Verrucomicrobiae bacterium]
MTEREKILGRIREALTLSAPHPGTHGGHEPAQTFTGRPVHSAQPWLPQGGETAEEQLERFRAASLDLKTDFRDGADEASAMAILKEIAQVEGWKKVAAHRSTLTDKATQALALPVLRTDSGYDKHEMEACDVGITECDVLVAQTGSLIVTSRSSGGRALSVLPPHHVVIARREQLVRDLSAAFALIQQKYADNYPSMISLVTGPSRTGDIERILVLGAHGPKKLTVILW